MQFRSFVIAETSGRGHLLGGSGHSWCYRLWRYLFDAFRNVVIVETSGKSYLLGGSGTLGSICYERRLRLLAYFPAVAA